jgi:hypothetical protein
VIGAAFWYNGNMVKAVGYRRDDTGVTVLALEDFRDEAEFPLKAINLFCKKIKASRTTLILSGDAAHVSFTKLAERHDREDMIAVRIPQGEKQIVIEVSKNKLEMYQKIRRLRAIISGVEVIKKSFSSLPGLDKKEAAIFVNNGKAGTLSVFNNRKLISVEEMALEGEAPGNILNKHFQYLRKRQEISLIDSLYVIGIETDLSDTGIANIHSLSDKGGMDNGGFDLSDAGTIVLFLLSGEAEREKGIYERFRRGSRVSLKTFDRGAAFLIIIAIFIASYLYLNTFISLASVKKRHLLSESKTKEIIERIRSQGGQEIKDLKQARMKLNKVMQSKSGRFPYMLPIEAAAYRLSDNLYIDEIILEGNKINMKLISEGSGDDMGKTIQRLNELAKTISGYPVFQEMMSKSGPQYVNRDKRFEFIIEGKLNRNIGENEK